VVHEAPAKAGAPRLVRVELVPTVGDPRFSYRQGDVPAASHPTIAAALARLAGAGPNDVVWDPFVGSGLELCERSLLGPSRRLLGTDLDVAALDVARENLRAAGARSFELVRADALAFRPAERPSVILTNPPMGRRVHRSADLGALLERFVAHAAAVLAPDRGRLVWITPMPDRTGAAARRAGLSPQFERDVDMGGFRARMQVLTAARRRA
jgi:23S rRNA G2445 N2-methylase RlmL